MPRKRKPEQPAAVSPGQVYGQGVDQMAAQAAIPLADLQQQRQNVATTNVPIPGASPLLPGAGGGVGGAAPAAAPPTGYDAALAAAHQMAPPGGNLSAMLANPALAGASTQYGRGVNLWVQLADLTGDPSFLALAQAARLGT